MNATVPPSVVSTVNKTVKRPSEPCHVVKCWATQTEMDVSAEGDGGREAWRESTGPLTRAGCAEEGSAERGFRVQTHRLAQQIFVLINGVEAAQDAQQCQCLDTYVAVSGRGGCENGRGMEGARARGGLTWKSACFLMVSTLAWPSSDRKLTAVMTPWAMKRRYPSAMSLHDRGSKPSRIEIRGGGKTPRGWQGDRRVLGIGGIPTLGDSQTACR